MILDERVFYYRDNMLPKEAIEEFKEIFRKKYGKELSEEEARKMAEHFFGLYCAIYDPEDKSVKSYEKKE